MLSPLLEFTWIDLLDIGLLSVLVYFIFSILRGTKGVQLFKGLVIVFLAMFLSRILGLRTLNWFLEKMLAFGALAILIIFQPEFRNALVRLGEADVLDKVHGLSPEKVGMSPGKLKEIVAAIFQLAQEGKGALIALERKVGLADYLSSGKRIDAEISRELLLAIFNPGGPLHDGAVIIAGDKIIGAACLLPLSERTDLEPTFGTRHRAALGLAEQTDSVIIVVSEEKGTVALAKDKQLTLSLSADRLTRILNNIFVPTRK